MPPVRLLIICTGNSARSQMAEGILQAKGAGRIQVASAGSHPAPAVHPLALEVLAEHGIAWHGRKPRGIAGLESEPWDLVITVCDNAREACPVFPAARAMVHWGMHDPSASPGSREERLAAFRTAYGLIEDRVDALLALPLESLTGRDLAMRAQAIHDR